MPYKKAKRLVVDASVGTASGGANAIWPRSVHCRDFLMAFDRLGFRLVLSNDILKEWKDHESSFAREWRIGMIAKKKIYPIEGKTVDDRFRAKIAKIGLNVRSLRELLKDCLLIEAAMKSDKSIISLDEEARLGFRRASLPIREIRTIVWVNPERTDDNPIGWLEEGAKNERYRLLGYRVNEES